MKLPFKKSKNGVTLEVRVQPRASSKKLVSVEDNVLRVKLTAPPADGLANAQLIEMLAKELRVRKGAFSIIKGKQSRSKVVEIEGYEGG